MKKIFLSLFLIGFFAAGISLADETYTVSIPSSNGTYKVIAITRQGDTYICPQGEHFNHFPTVYELEALYNGGTISPPSQGVPNAVSPDTQGAVANERLLRAQMQQGADETAARQKEMEIESQQNLLQEQQKAKFQAAHPFGIPTPVEQKKIDRDWFIMGWFAGILLFITLGFLVFILLLHLPNRIIGPDHPVRELPLAVAVRRGMTKARFNASVSPFIFFELFFITVLVGIGFKSFLAFAIAVLAAIVLMSIKTSAFILMYLFSTYWMLLAAEIGYCLCGGQLITTENYVFAWVGGFIFAVLGFLVSFGIHTAGLQYYEDISN